MKLGLTIATLTVIGTSLFAIFGVPLYVDLPLTLASILTDTDFGGALDLINDQIPALATLWTIVKAIFYVELTLLVFEIITQYKNIF